MSNRTARRYADQRDEAQSANARLLSENARLVFELSEITKERDEARRLSNFVLCSYCGLQTERAETTEQTADLMVEHITACPAHPFSVAEAAVAAHEAANTSSLEALKKALPGFIELHAQGIGCPECPPTENDVDRALVGRCPAVSEIEGAIAQAEALLPAPPDPTPDAHLEVAHEERESQE